MSAAIELKRGDTLDLDCTVQASGVPLDIAGWYIESCVRRFDGAVLHRFAAQVADAPSGRYRLLADAATTAAWPAGAASMDIRYTDASGHVMTTRTVPVHIAEPITAP